MQNRTLAIILSLLVIFFIGIPGLGLLCVGSTSFMLYIFSNPLNIQSGWAGAFGFVGLSGLCIGFIMVLITIIVSYLLLHRKPEYIETKPVVATPTPTIVEPVQQTSTEKPAPPTTPDEPLPPTI